MPNTEPNKPDPRHAADGYLFKMMRFGPLGSVSYYLADGMAVPFTQAAPALAPSVGFLSAREIVVATRPPIERSSGQVRKIDLALWRLLRRLRAVFPALRSAPRRLLRLAMRSAYAPQREGGAQA